MTFYAGLAIGFVVALGVGHILNMVLDHLLKFIDRSHTYCDRCGAEVRDEQAGRIMWPPRRWHRT